MTGLKGRSANPRTAHQGNKFSEEISASSFLVFLTRHNVPHGKNKQHRLRAERKVFPTGQHPHRGWWACMEDDSPIMSNQEKQKRDTANAVSWYRSTLKGRVHFARHLLEEIRANRDCG